MKMQELEVKKESEYRGEILSAPPGMCSANYLTPIENKCINDDIGLPLKNDNVNQNNSYVIQWVEPNNNDNGNRVHQVLIGNCSEQNVERYADFVINGHFLTDLLPIEPPEVTRMIKECPTCNKKLKPGGFKRHNAYCKKLPDLRCSYCSFSTKSKQDLSNHTKLEHIDKYEPENNAKLMCLTRDKELDSQKFLEVHKYICKTPQYFHCNGCCYYTKYKSNLIRHIETSHFSDQSAACPKCGKKLKNRHTLNVHKTYCGKEPHLPCDLCSFKTKYKSNFILHCAKVHFKDVESIKMSHEIFKNVKDSAIEKVIGYGKCLEKNKKCTDNDIISLNTQLSI